MEWTENHDDDVAFMAELITFSACLPDYVTPTEQPSADASELEHLRWRLAFFEQQHPEIVWRAWVHPQQPDAYWLQIGGCSARVTYTEACMSAEFAAGALRATRP